MITREKISKISQTIREVSNPAAIYLFGSYASGKANDNSDLDIAIIKNNVSDKHKELLKIRKALFKNWVPMDLILLDVSEFKRKKNVFGTVQYEIESKGVKLYGQ